jgi:hypothetical protein
MLRLDRQERDMNFFSITTTMLSDNGANVSFVFRPDDDDIETIKDLSEELAENGCVSGVRWKFSRGELIEPRETIVGLQGIVTIQRFLHSAADNAPEPTGGASWA